MELESKRLFLNNLPNNVTRPELEAKFSEYGVVSNVEIKERKTITSNQTPHFGYVQLQIDRANLQNCLEEFSNKKWKGQYIDVQIAKESFMERLKREREEKVNGTSIPSIKNVPTYSNDANTENKTKSTVVSRIPIYPEESNFVNNTASTSISVNNKKYHSSSSESSEEEDTNLQISRNQDVPNNKSVSNEEQVNKLLTENKTFEKRLKIASVDKGSVVAISKEQKKFGPKQMQADKKRLESIVQMKQEYRQQKSLIKNALANIDTKPKNKIIFNDDDESEPSPSKKSKFEEGPTPRTKNKTSDTQNRFTLFDDAEDENDHEYNFEVKEHFEGKKGKKLMELQSRFKNDKRFTMDARFLEDQSDEEAENGKNETQEDQEVSYENEKEKQLDILEQVLGQKISRKPADKKSNDSKKTKMMLRFDPSQPEHSKYEVKEPVGQEKTKVKLRHDSEKETGAKPVEEAPIPEVSKDTFYKVAVDLKDALHEKQEFSLASLFSKAIEYDEQEEETQAENQPKQIKKKKRGHEPNPFRYDSSTDDESENEKEKAQEKSRAANDSTKTEPVALQRTRPARIWTEPFFFKKDDYRLQEGFDFIKKLELDDQGDFLTLRRNLKEIVRAKVKNNQRNNRPFKRKLGGKKRIRVKRALKR